MNPSDRCLSSVVFYRLRRALMTLSGVPRSSIRPSTATETLLPQQTRRLHWEQLARMTGSRLPDLQRPQWVQNLLMGSGCVAAILTAVVYSLFSVKLAILICAAALLCVWLAHRLTIPLADRLPANCGTVEGITRAILRRNYGIYAKRAKAWSDSEVWSTLQDVIVDELSVKPEAVTKDAQFVRDLRLG